MTCCGVPSSSAVVSTGLGSTLAWDPSVCADVPSTRFTAADEDRDRSALQDATPRTAPHLRTGYISQMEQQPLAEVPHPRCRRLLSTSSTGCSCCGCLSPVSDTSLLAK
eukprot:GHVU01169897.1.p2 GENE.GHVU01169897.1~~GHVU01169897.1.p2  ORF type:complete len:109 (+),score=7.12 GHVU01169897.1:497-823(+)